ncbi:hypothetical protein ACHWGL_33045, partial [Klebsiella pneumoniae]|uniref:hypothetical protein n=1 Tax=Klebsiella pneumoniae TaxID=573 RepID=UPI00376ED06D
ALERARLEDAEHLDRQLLVAAQGKRGQARGPGRRRGHPRARLRSTELMNIAEIKKTAEQKMQKSVEAFKQELTKIR